MNRIKINARKDWQKKIEAVGFGYHSTDGPYWNEQAYYSFTLAEINQIEKATEELWTMCLEAVQYVIDQNCWKVFDIPEAQAAYIRSTWDEDAPSIYGRFDLCVKDGKIKLLEFNADTPTSLFEAAIIQWFWLQDFAPEKDQFNSLHEKLVGYWKQLKPFLHPGPLYFGCLKNTLEDLTNTEYLRDCAMQAGLETKLIFMEDIGWDDAAGDFVDMDHTPITNIFKLYPWEWLINEAFGQHIWKKHNNSIWIEPAWKMILSNKAILTILWHLFPDHPLLLPAFIEPNKLSSYVKKPMLSREGANIELIHNHLTAEKSEGIYSSNRPVYQQLFELPNFDGQHALVGSWIVGQQAAGIGIRESDGLITTNTSRFVPHLIEG